MPIVQKAKLKHVSMSGNIMHMVTLANSYVKSSKKGFIDKVTQLIEICHLDKASTPNKTI